MTETSTDKKPPRTWLVDAEAGHTWTQWPHFFNYLHFRYNTPHSLFVTLSFLWSAVTGKEWPEGQIALSQIPVEGRKLRKWIEAFLAAKIFELPYGAEPEGSQEGSTYQYKETSFHEWEAFFDLAARVKALGGLSDDVPAKAFGKLFVGIKPPRKTVEAIPADERVQVSEENERMAKAISAWLDNAALHPKKYRKKPTGPVP